MEGGTQGARSPSVKVARRTLTPTPPSKKCSRLAKKQKQLLCGRCFVTFDYSHKRKWLKQPPSQNMVPINFAIGGQRVARVIHHSWSLATFMQIFPDTLRESIFSNASDTASSPNTSPTWGASFPSSAQAASSLSSSCDFGNRIQKS